MSVRIASCNPSWGAIAGSLIEYPIQKQYIERVLYNAPATIIFWSNGEKTVVKCHECPMCGKCDRYRVEDGACGYRDPNAWRRNGVINASLKRTFPNYIDQFNKALGE